MADAKIRELILPDGTKLRGIELEFEILKEDWNEYQLSDGTKLRVKNALVKAFRVVDEAGNPTNIIIRTETETASRSYEQPFDSAVTSVLQEDGNHVWYAIHPISSERVEIDSNQLWFWTAEWQAKEREADEDVRLGRYEEFENMDDFIDSLS